MLLFHGSFNSFSLTNNIEPFFGYFFPFCTYSFVICLLKSFANFLWGYSVCLSDFGEIFILAMNLLSNVSLQIFFSPGYGLSIFFNGFFGWTELSTLMKPNLFFLLWLLIFMSSLRNHCLPPSYNDILLIVSAFTYGIRNHYKVMFVYYVK